VSRVQRGVPAGTRWSRRRSSAVRVALAGYGEDEPIARDELPSRVTPAEWTFTMTPDPP